MFTPQDIQSLIDACMYAAMLGGFLGWLVTELVAYLLSIWRKESE